LPPSPSPIPSLSLPFTIPSQPIKPSPHPSPMPSPPLTWSHTQASHMFPLCEVAGAEGTIWVHVPFSLSDMSQIENHLGCFSENPARFCKEFLPITQAYHNLG
jgi:hypothetical protein